MTLPSTLTFGVVRDWGEVVSASLDANATPDATGVVGVVTFTPSVPVHMVTDSPRSRWLAIKPHQFGYDAEGILRDGQGNDGVTLIATDSPGLSRQGWQWIAEFHMKNKVTRPKFAFELPGGEIIDLADVTPVQITNGVAIIRGPSGLLDDSNLAAILNDPTSASYGLVAALVETLGASLTVTEDPAHPGFYLFTTSPGGGSSGGGSTFTPDPDNDGLYLMGS